MASQYPYRETVSVPRRAFISFLLPGLGGVAEAIAKKVSVPRRAFISFLQRMDGPDTTGDALGVSVPRRAFISFLHGDADIEDVSEQDGSFSAP